MSIALGLAQSRVADWDNKDSKRYSDGVTWKHGEPDDIVIARELMSISLASDLEKTKQMLDGFSIDYTVRDGDRADGEFVYQYLFFGKPESAEFQLNYKTSDLSKLTVCCKFWEFENKKLVSWS